MSGGNLQLSSAMLQSDTLFIGNPKKSFFKSTYLKYTNFAIQSYVTNFEGSRTLNLDTTTKYTFKIKRQADLLMDTYFVITLPDIYSPIMPPRILNSTIPPEYTPWSPYEFRWIDDIGTQIIQEIEIYAGNQTLQRLSGQYLNAMTKRDLTLTKKIAYDQLTGNVLELNNPAEVNGYKYPNSLPVVNNQVGCNPSIVGRTLYVPIGAWFCNNSQMAVPLCCLQLNELQIDITLRPLYEWFVIKDVLSYDYPQQWIAPNFNQWEQQFYRFLQPPPDFYLEQSSYVNKNTTWNSNVHLLSNYGFLDTDERNLFTQKKQEYLIKQVFKKTFYNVTTNNRVELDSLGLVHNYLFYFQRSDAFLRNQWSNFSNWMYNNVIPDPVIQAPTTGTYPILDATGTQIFIGPGEDPNTLTYNNLYWSGDYNTANQQQILINAAIMMDGSYREDLRSFGFFNYIQQYQKSNGPIYSGLYNYSFGLSGTYYEMQPKGTMEMNSFNKIELEFNTINPPLNPSAQSLTICDPQTQSPIGINKQSFNIYQYNYDLHFFEERANKVIFESGLVGMEFANF
jgi:hypothetical protein